MAIKKKYQYIGLGVGVAILLVGGKVAMDHGLIPKVAGMAAKVPEKVTLAAGDVNQGPPTQSYELPAPAPSAALGGTPKILTIAWQATGALNLANGGADTKPGSLLAQYTGQTVHIERQDDYGVMQQEQLKFATALGNNASSTPSEGAAFVEIMGDGYPAYIAALAPQMKKLGQSVAVIDVIGFSYGEDKCMAPDVHGDPQKARGDVIAAVPRDGDWNICVKWASDNNIPINTDNKVYDPTAINFVDTNSFTDADDKYVAGYCETRDEAKGGIATGKKVQACVNGVATWTPGDVAVALKKGGAVTLASTKQYTKQMPAVLIGNTQWMAAHKDFVVGMLRATDRAAFVIRANSDGVTKMAAVHAEIFGGNGGGDEGDPAYWAKYYTSVDQKDATGVMVNLGGSRVTTLAEAKQFFGMGGGFDAYKAVYKVFGDYDHEFYPDLVKNIPAYSDVVDTSYISAALEGVNVGAAKQEFAEKKAITQTISKGTYAIEFQTGSDKISPASATILNNIADQAGMTNLRMRIEGHTDNTGDSTNNLTLSSKRAQAVADYLTASAPDTFPATRFNVRGYGDTQPIADNSTADGRTHNRRVVVVMGQ